MLPWFILLSALYGVLRLGQDAASWVHKAKLAMLRREEQRTWRLLAERRAIVRKLKQQAKALGISAPTKDKS